jgi:indole-3-glycerol phosphate synthase
VIAEVKRASPSQGPIAPGLDAAAQATAYQRGGAAAVSVLTEPTRFAGSLDDLAAVSATGVSALRKDFIVDRYQIWEARAAGAAAVLLIVAALDDRTLAGLHDEAALAGLDALVEVHDVEEAARAAAIGARIVGVNARNLRTFEVDPEAFARLRASLPAQALAVAESGISTPEQVREAAACGADAVLVGESLVRAADPAAAVAALVAAGRADVAPARDAAAPPSNAPPRASNVPTRPSNAPARPTVQGSST